jgi:hypothetical protein
MPQTDNDLFGSSSLLDRLGRTKPPKEPEPTDAGAKALKHQSTKAVVAPKVLPSATAAEHVRVSVYLTPELLDSLDQAVIQSRRAAAGRKKDRSALIREAVSAWLKGR